MATAFRPEHWAHSALNTMGSMITLTPWVDEHRRLGHTEFTPLTKTELRTRKHALKKWKKLTRKLTKAGYLERDFCTDCAGELIPTTNTHHREYVYDETEQEHATRIAALPEHPATFKLPKRTPILTEDSTTLNNAL